MLDILKPQFEFSLPPALEAQAPPEARGIGRDQVRLLVSHYGDDRMHSGQFYGLPAHLEAGDVLVINTSRTRSAALPAWHNGIEIAVHVSTQLQADPLPLAVVELRRLTPDGTRPLMDATPTDRITLANGGSVRLLAPHNGSRRLWLAALSLNETLHEHMERFGRPIRYSYVSQAWPSEMYQTVFADLRSASGSAEMPSAGRAFTAELVTELVTKGIQFAPITLHTGVASLENHEMPYAEWFEVSETTATLLNRAVADGRRIIAIGTTAVRAVESAVTITLDGTPTVHAQRGWTERLISETTPPAIINGLLTGFHEPEATHLAMLTAVAGTSHIRQTYEVALTEQFLWHEFGDLHLILP